MKRGYKIIVKIALAQSLQSSIFSDYYYSIYRTSINYKDWRLKDDNDDDVNRTTYGTCLIY